MKNLMNEIYWLVEDLKSYTDLTGDRFDTEKATILLWKMNPILKSNDLPDVQKLQEELLELLERPMFFNKSAFSEKVDELYDLSEKHRNDV